MHSLLRSTKASTPHSAYMYLFEVHAWDKHPTTRASRILPLYLEDLVSDSTIAELRTVGLLRGLSMPVQTAGSS